MQFPYDPTALPQEIVSVSCVLCSDLLGRQEFFQPHVTPDGQQTLVQCRDRRRLANGNVQLAKTKLQQIPVNFCAAQAPAAAGRLWLTGTLQSNAGLLGLMKCARAEPRGGALRCVMDASSKYSLHTGDR